MVVVRGLRAGRDHVRPYDSGIMPLICMNLCAILVNIEYGTGIMLWCHVSHINQRGRGSDPRTPLDQGRPPLATPSNPSLLLKKEIKGNVPPPTRPPLASHHPRSLAPRLAPHSPAAARATPGGAAARLRLRSPLPRHSATRIDPCLGSPGSLGCSLLGRDTGTDHRSTRPARRKCIHMHSPANEFSL